MSDLLCPICSSKDLDLCSKGRYWCNNCDNLVEEVVMIWLRKKKREVKTLTEELTYREFLGMLKEVFDITDQEITEKKDILKRIRATKISK
jgi:hypothetical protein